MVGSADGWTRDRSSYTICRALVCFSPLRTERDTSSLTQSCCDPNRVKRNTDSDEVSLFIEENATLRACETV